MKENIPEFLKNEFTKGKSFTNKFPDEIKQFMIDYANYYNWGLNDNLKNIFRMMKQGISELPTCKLDGCNKKVKYSVGKGTFTETCCEEHSRKAYYLENYGVENVSQLDETKKKKKETCIKNHGVEVYTQSPELREKAKKTNIEKYGVENPMQSEEIKEKAKQTNLKKYGVENPMQSEEIKEKAKQNLLEKYGVTNISNNPTFRRKAEQTMLKKYGKKHYTQTDEYIEKSTKTNLKKYGVEWASQSNESKKKYKETCLKKYGVSHPSQNPGIAEKMISGLYRKKEYLWKSGEVSIVQGNEPILLSELEEQGYTFHEIITSPKEMPEIWYEFNGNKKRYFPDIYIPNENLIIEVKSSYTITQDIDKNKAKWCAVKENGYQFKLEVR